MVKTELWRASTHANMASPLRSHCIDKLWKVSTSTDLNMVDDTLRSFPPVVVGSYLKKKRLQWLWMPHEKGRITVHLGGILVFDFVLLLSSVALSWGLGDSESQFLDIKIQTLHLWQEAWARKALWRSELTKTKPALVDSGPLMELCITIWFPVVLEKKTLVLDPEV